MKQRLRDPAIPLRTVPCPECSAGIGQPCLSRAGITINSGHQARRRLAMRSN